MAQILGKRRRMDPLRLATLVPEGERSRVARVLAGEGATHTQVEARRRQLLKWIAGTDMGDDGLVGISAKNAAALAAAIPCEVEELLEPDDPGAAAIRQAERHERLAERYRERAAALRRGLPPGRPGAAER